MTSAYGVAFLSMKIIPRAKVDAFCERFPKARAPLNALLNEAERANWEKPHDIKSRYRNARILKGGRVVFRIGGNKYRIIVRFGHPPTGERHSKVELLALACFGRSGHAFPFSRIHPALPMFRQQYRSDATISGETTSNSPST